MSKPGVLYVGTFKDLQADHDTSNTLNQRDHTILIYDYGTLIDDAATEQQVELSLAGAPLMSRTEDTDEDKFTPIRSTQVDVIVHTDSQVNLDTFCDGEDNRFYLWWLVAGQTFFKGWLVQDEMQVDFQPHPNELTLSFSDNLSILRDKPLVDSDGDNIQGYNKIMHYIVSALAQTGLTLPINVVNNLREEHTAPLVTDDASFTTGTNLITLPSNDFFLTGKSFTVAGSASNDGTYTVVSMTESLGLDFIVVTPGLTTEAAGATVTFQDTNPHFYDSLYLEARTFEAEVGESEDCYTVLEKILGEHCTLFQQWGEWYIVSVDERDDMFQRVAHFNTAGTFQSFTTDANYYKNIGIDENIHFINEDALVKPQRPFKYVKLTYNYEPPKEIPCNATFTRGTERPESPSDTTVTRYEPTCWTARKGVPGAYLSEGVEFYIEVQYNDLGYEEERYIVITPEATHDASSTRQTYIESEFVPVTENDKFEASVDWRYSASGGSGPSGFNRMKLYLRGDDGSDWLLGHNTITDSTTGFRWWNTSNFTLNTIAGIENTPDFSIIDETDWQSQSFSAPPIPVTGKLYIWLHQANQNSTADDDRTIHYANLNFTYTPYINGTYQNYSGQHHKITRDGDYNAKREQQVYISDSPKPLFKGAIFKKNGTNYILAESFYKAYVTVPPLMPASTEFKKMGEWQAWWVWNQYRLSTRHFEFTAQGLDTDAMYNGTLVDPCSLLHKYYIVDEDASSNTRQFMLLHYEANWEENSWTGYLSEVMNFNEGKSYSDDSEFKYISS